MIVVKTAAEIEKMRRIGRIVAQAHRLVEESIVPGITTEELDEKVARFFEEQGVKGAFLGYEGYPKNICTSVNEEVVHGIPGPRRLVEGDIVGIDIGASLDGYFADMARTLPVGEISDEARRLLQVTEEALYKGIEKAVPGDGFPTYPMPSKPTSRRLVFRWCGSSWGTAWAGRCTRRPRYPTSVLPGGGRGCG